METKSVLKEKANILIVDDNPANLLSLESSLEADDLNFIRALSGEEALEAALKYLPALVLLDVQMPGMNGFEVARMLRGMELTRQIPIIFVTATHREEKFAFQGFENGAVDYLFKPLNTVVLRSKVNVFVELYRNRMRLERANRELTMVNKELESFSYSVSHDLRAPLRRMLGFTQPVYEDLKAPEFAEQRELLARALKCGSQMGDLIAGLLELARVTTAEPTHDAVSLTVLAKQIFEDLKSEEPKRGVETLVAEDANAIGDKRMLHSVLLNLIGNSWKFTSKTENATITFGAKENNGVVTYFVEDNGAGFDTNYASRLFGAFQRFHSDKDFKGTGVGLATVQRIVHRHGGRIWAESEPGRRTAFYFTLWDHLAK